MPTRLGKPEFPVEANPVEILLDAHAVPLEDAMITHGGSDQYKEDRH